jgi:hypothetical protein
MPFSFQAALGADERRAFVACLAQKALERWKEQMLYQKATRTTRKSGKDIEFPDSINGI